MVAVSFVTSFLLPAIVLALPAIDANSNSGHGQGHSQVALASDALKEILTRGAPILGTLHILELSFTTDVSL
jgi:hypothetical protein